MKFFFLNILKTKCNSVRERAFFTLSRTLLCVVFKIFKKINFTLNKSAFLHNLRFFPNKCTHLLKTGNFGPQGPQNEALQQRYSPCQSKKPNFSGEIENNLTKIQILPQNFFPEWFGPKKIEAIRFGNGFREKSAQTDCSKEMWIPILKGLKHLKPVLQQYFAFSSQFSSTFQLFLVVFFSSFFFVVTGGGRVRANY